ncbi:MAG: DUF4258 domain-containing protein [Ignavibacteriaceae bacterium]|jgi:hypothetical protein|nr:DUF4258 domain-containing protein [Ignavibacteriaceae bacterium]
MEIQFIKDRIKTGDYEISFHAEEERYAEDISIDDIEAAILNGEILENYSDDPRGKSYLILGYSEKKAIHIVCGLTTLKSVRIITVYLPALPKWIDERTRKKKEN